jgi:hypothetical protein
LGIRQYPRISRGSQPGAGIADGLAEGVVVPGLVEDGLAAVAAVEDVVPDAADGSSGSSGYAIIVKHARSAVNIGYVPFSPFSWVVLASVPGDTIPLFLAVRLPSRGPRSPATSSDDASAEPKVDGEGRGHA